MREINASEYAIRRSVADNFHALIRNAGEGSGRAIQDLSSVLRSSGSNPNLIIYEIAIKAWVLALPEARAILDPWLIASGVCENCLYARAETLFRYAVAAEMYRSCSADDPAEEDLEKQCWDMLYPEECDD